MSYLLVDVGGVVNNRERADHLIVAVKRQGVNVDRSVVHAEELPVASIALGGKRRGGRAELEQRSKAGCYGEGHAIGVVNGNPFQVLALAEAIHEALQTLVRQGAVKLRLDIFLQAFPENFRSAGEIVAQDAALGADLVAGEKQGHDNDADNKRRDKFQCRAHWILPLGQERRFRFGFARAMRIRRVKKNRHLSRRVRRLYDYVSSNVDSIVGSIIDRGLGANFKSSLDLGPCRRSGAGGRPSPGSSLRQPRRKRLRWLKFCRKRSRARWLL